MPAPSHADLARALVDKFPDSSMHQLARILYRDNKERFRDVHAARVIISRVCGRMGKGCRVKVTHPLPPRDRSWNKCPPSLAEPWEPFVLPTPCRVLSLSDAHVPYHAPKAIEAAVEHARKHYKPDVLLLNGDHADERVANARARCPHAAVIAETSQCYTTYTCRDCGQYSTEPFGGGDA